jgi:hypothetical protein
MFDIKILIFRGEVRCAALGNIAQNKKFRSRGFGIFSSSIAAIFPFLGKIERASLKAAYRTPPTPSHVESFLPLKIVEVVYYLYMSKSSSAAVEVAPKVKRAPAKKAPRKIALKDSKKAPLAMTARKIQTTNTGIKRNPLGHLLMEKMLREAGFHGEVSSKKELLDKYSTDESIFSIRPQVVIRPKHKVDVEVLVKTIGSETKRFSSLSLTPRSAGTGLSGGSLTDSIVVDMTDLNKMGDVTVKKDKITFTLSLIHI